MDSVWLQEDHFNPENSISASPLVILGAIAARTSRVRIGMAVVVLPLFNPIQVAEDVATVDHLSKGRFDFGIGRSNLTRYSHGYNVSYAESRGRLFEGLDVIMKAWGNERFSHEGEYYSFHDVHLVPKPYQKPHPPTWIAALSEDTSALVARLAYPIFLLALPGFPRIKEQHEQAVRWYRQAWQEAGHAGSGGVMLRIPAYVAETAERARSEPETSTMQHVQFMARAYPSI